MPDEYWKLTRGETFAKASGHSRLDAARSNDFRQLYHLTYSLNSKQKKTPKQLWPLLIDNVDISKKKIDWLKNIQNG